MGRAMFDLLSTILSLRVSIQEAEELPTSDVVDSSIRDKLVLMGHGVVIHFLALGSLIEKDDSHL